ncbi:6,7-dimethyl-8-ribityllumazine synthase [Paracoccus aminophilus]|uniref:6,7-dimethyl-8-ribityllumazine synthase n=1 Tax=Paracoccus aminophilus JCM 7686 TaxID=1367847 RepID=S5YTU7_PARAH|nr:6,7-dimethyl-8-ribityllumazine synthase [Paracoccus aminophilus]AGT08641.1 riboflavin synthase beta chain [Paracoccus aminophilus JCM 7686]
MASSVEHYQLPLPALEGSTRLLIVVSPYYSNIAKNLVEGARAVALEAGASVDVLEVPGALEIPSAIALAAAGGHYDGYVGLGCVIRGETTHYDTVCNDSSRGLMLLGLQGHAIGNGILTVENAEQAEVRADAKGQNKGGGAAAAALHLIAIRRKFAALSPRADKALPEGSILLAGATSGSTNA